MNDHIDAPSPAEDDDPVLAAAGQRLRGASRAISPDAVEVAVLRRRSRRMGLVTAACLTAVVVLGGVLVLKSDPKPTVDLSVDRPGAPRSSEVESLLRSLDDQPVDPTKVKLVSSVRTFTDCDALIGDLRRVGAEHVGSRGFGGFSDGNLFNTVGADIESRQTSAVANDAMSAPAPASGGETLGTNVQVAGVDELDYVKAVGSLIYDLDGKGNLRITDAKTVKVLAALDVTPPGPNRGEKRVGSRGGETQVSQLLVAGGKVAIFGVETEVSKAVEGDPSATRAATTYMTVTFVDASDPAKPTVTDRVRVEGSLVSARLVDGEIRLVTTSNMADLGFVMPTTPNSVSKALEQNRRSVASSVAPDWIPDWQRRGEAPEPLVPCARVHVPDTFAGVAMTSMVTFPLGTGRFEPAGTSILAPATTLYAGLDKVAISSEVWVDPIDRERLKFDDWQTAIHEFDFADKTAPTYAGSGIVDGSTIGQFAFGEIGTSLAVVTTKGTPWQQNTKVGVDMTILTPDGDGGLDETSKVADLAGDEGVVTAVRFVEGRVLISTGALGNRVHVIDVTKPAEPRRAGSIDVHSAIGYFHPLPDQQALLVGSRSDTVGTGRNKRSRSWVQALLLDVRDADTPKIASTWERPWSGDEVGSDHHAFTYWPARKLAMWGIQDNQGGSTRQNHAIVLGVGAGLTEVAVPVANKPPETPPPCPTVAITDPRIREMIGRDSIVLRCADLKLQELEWPRYQCYRVDAGTVARLAPGEEKKAGFFSCSPAPQPTVSRVLVVDGKPMLLTDQTLQVLDPATFRSTSVTFHLSGGMYRMF